MRRRLHLSEVKQGRTRQGARGKALANDLWEYLEESD